MASPIRRNGPTRRPVQPHLLAVRFEFKNFAKMGDRPLRLATAEIGVPHAQVGFHQIRVADQDILDRPYRLLD